MLRTLKERHVLSITAGIRLLTYLILSFDIILYYSYLMNSIPQWFVRFSQLRLYSKTQEEPYDLLFFLSKFYQATLYYTLNGELKPSSYLAAFADVGHLIPFYELPFGRVCC